MHATWLVITAVVLQDGSTDPTCGPFPGLGGAPGWLICQIQVHSSVIRTVAEVVGATAALGWLIFAVVKWKIEDTGDEKRTDAADGRIANLASPVSRTLAKSLEEGWRLDDAPIYRRDRARELQVGFHEHEPRIEEMLDVAIDASPEVDDAVTRAADLFWDAADGVNDMAAFEPQHMGDTPRDDVLDGYRDAKSMTEDCVEILERLDARVGDADDE